MATITPCLWFNGDAEEAARFYAAVLPDGRIEAIHRNSTDGPSGPAGSVLVVTLGAAGQRFIALNGGMPAEYSHAVSFQIACDDQPQIDRLWDALSAGGKVERCGWLRDRWGVPWQVVPAVLPAMLSDPDPARCARVFQAMLGMVKLDIAALQRAYDAV